MNSEANARGLTVFFASLLVMSTLFLGGNLSGFAGGNYEFAAEYGNIGAAIAEGRGFSDPFGTPTGPTAWMPPAYPLLLAALFKLFGVKSTLSLAVLVLIELLGLALIPTLLFNLLETRQTRLPAVAIVPMFISVMFTSYIQLFQSVHDCWLVMLAATLLLVGFASPDAPQGRGRRDIPLWWGGVGGLIALVSPILGAVALFMVGRSSNRNNWRNNLMVIGVAVVAVSPWVLRNHLVFDKFIPVKSNLVFDAYQGNYLDDDGILTIETFRRFHPYKNEEMRRDYAALGEKRFMEEYEAKLKAAFSDGMETFVDKSMNRLLHIVFVHPNAVRFWEADGPGVRLGIFLLLRDALYALPAIAIGILLVSGRFKTESILKWAGWICVLSMLPYVFVGFYTRYRITLYPLFAVFYFLLANHVLETLWPRRTIDAASRGP